MSLSLPDTRLELVENATGDWLIAVNSLPSAQPPLRITLDGTDVLFATEGETYRISGLPAEAALRLKEARPSTLLVSEIDREGQLRRATRVRTQF